MYNAQTENQRGTNRPVEITVFEDRSFTFILKNAAHAGAAPSGRGPRQGLDRTRT